MDDGIEAEALGRQIAADAARAMADGTYPDEVLAELDGQWRRVSAQPDDRFAALLHEQLDTVGHSGRLHVPDVAPSSSMPGGALLHRFIGQSVARHMTELVGQIERYTSDVHVLFASVIRALEAEPTHIHTDLVGQLEALEGRTAELLRAVNRRDVEPDR